MRIPRSVSCCVLIGGFIAHSGCSQKAPVSLDSSIRTRQATTAEEIGKQCVVDIRKEILLLDLRLVNDPVRAPEPCDAQSGDRLGEFSFGLLMTRMAQLAGAPDPRQFVEDWASQWTANQTLRRYTALARPEFEQKIMTPWRNRSGGTIDLALAPFRLMAVSNRMDLAESDQEGAPLNAGEAHLLFNAVDISNCGVLPPDGGRPLTDQLPFTVIFEFKLPASSREEVLNWAEHWHSLGQLEFGDELNLKLQHMANGFERNLSQVRTNDFLPKDRLGQIAAWEWRGTVLSKGRLVATGSDQTPNGLRNGTSELAAYLNDHEEEIISGTHVVPEQVIGPASNLLLNDDGTETHWRAEGVRNNEARHRFAMATCNGCHHGEGVAPFFHVLPRDRHLESATSQFLRGATVVDVEDGKTERRFAELQRRADFLRSVLGCGQATRTDHGIPEQTDD